MGRTFWNSLMTVQTVPYNKISIMKLFLVLSCLVAAAMAAPETKSESEPGCSLCMVVLGDITNWITGEEQEAVVIEVLEQIAPCSGSWSRVNQLSLTTANCSWRKTFHPSSRASSTTTSTLRTCATESESAREPDSGAHFTQIKILVNK